MFYHEVGINKFPETPIVGMVVSSNLIFLNAEV